MLKVNFLVVTLLLLSFVCDTESWIGRQRRRRRFSFPCAARNCEVSTWSEWSPCSQKCGTNGLQKKTRNITVTAACGGVCPFDLIEKRPCNRDRSKCKNSGKPMSLGCSCPPGFKGTCCEIAQWTSTSSPRSTPYSSVSNATLTPSSTPLTSQPPTTDSLPTFLQEPPNPTFVVEGNNISLEWQYDLGSGGFRRVLFSLIISPLSRPVGLITELDSASGQFTDRDYVDRLQVNITSSRASITILAANSNDSGVYQLQIINTFGLRARSRVTIQVLSLPTSTPSSVNTTTLPPSSTPLTSQPPTTAFTRPSVTNSPPLHFANFLSLNNGRYNVSWMYNSSTDRLHFVTEVMTSGWMGFGFANLAPTGMIGYDVAVGGVLINGTGYLRDYLTVGRTLPALDSRQDWVLTYSREENGKTTLKFYRQRNTTDQNDVAIQPGAPIFLIWAYHPTTDVDVLSGLFPFHGFGSRGFQSAVLIPSIATPPPQVNATSTPFPVFNATQTPPPVSVTTRPPFSASTRPPVTNSPPIHFANFLSFNNGRYNVSWMYNSSTDRLHFVTEVMASGWVGFGFANQAPTGMIGYDVAVGGVLNGTGYLRDYITIGFTTPRLDSRQDWVLTYSREENGKTTLAFYRQRNTTDQNDVAIRPGVPIFLIWAYHQTTDVQSGRFLFHTSRGFQRAVLIPSIATPPPQVNATSTPFPVFNATQTPPPVPVTTRPPLDACGGNFFGLSGSFASPGYPFAYTNNLDCLWTIRIPSNGVVRLQFNVFETEPCCDFVEITDIFGTRIERISGSRSGFSITVRRDRTPVLRVRFTTDSSVTRRGFLAQYSITFVNASSTPFPVFNATQTPSPIPMTTRPPIIECGGLLNRSSGFFTSPGFPGPYFNNLNCIWILPVPSRGSVFLEAIVFETEECCDFVELTDRLGRIIANVSGFQSGANITFAGDDLGFVRIRFTTNSNVTRRGFLARYRTTFFPVTPSIAPTPSSSAIVATSTPVFPTQPPVIACGGSFSALSGSFASPGYPGQYNNNLDCSWTLSIPFNGFLRLEFIVFETESCCDFVEFFDIFGVRLNRLSGSRSGFITTFDRDITPVLRVRFRTDSSVTRQGFLAQFTFVSVTPSLAPTPSSSVIVATSTPVFPTQPPIIGCGGVLPGSSGSFASPGYPVQYTNNLNCLWTLSIPFNGFLLLRFIVFETERGFDFVTLTDSSGQRIERLDGSQSGFSITLSGSNTTLLRITLTTDGSVVRQGFLAQYTINVVQPSPTSSTPVMSSTAVPQVTIPPDVQRALVNLLASLCQIIQRLQALLGGSFSPTEFYNFRNQTFHILQQAENQLFSASCSHQLRSYRLAKRSIPELSTPQEMVQMLENIQRRLLG